MIPKCYRCQTVLDTGLNCHKCGANNQPTRTGTAVRIPKAEWFYDKSGKLIKDFSVGMR